MNSISRKMVKSISKKGWLLVYGVTIFLVILSYIFWEPPLLKIIIEKAGFDFFLLGQMVVPILIYLYLERKSKEGLGKIFIFLICRYITLYLTVTILYKKERIITLAITYYCLFYLSTFLPYYLFFTNKNNLLSIKKSLILAIKKSFVLMYYTVIIILIMISPFNAYSGKLIYYIMLALVFNILEIEKYIIWKREVELNEI